MVIESSGSPTLSRWRGNKTITTVKRMFNSRGFRKSSFIFILIYTVYTLFPVNKTSPDKSGNISATTGEFNSFFQLILANHFIQWFSIRNVTCVVFLKHRQNSTVATLCLTASRPNTRSNKEKFCSQFFI